MIQYINNDCPIIVLPELSCDHKLSSNSDVMSPSSSPVVAMDTTCMLISSVSMVVSDSVSTGIVIIKSIVHPTLRPMIQILFY